MSPTWIKMTSPSLLNLAELVLGVELVADDAGGGEDVPRPRQLLLLPQLMEMGMGRRTHLRPLLLLADEGGEEVADGVVEEEGAEAGLLLPWRLPSLGLIQNPKAMARKETLNLRLKIGQKIQLSRLQKRMRWKWSHQSRKHNPQKMLK